MTSSPTLLWDEKRGSEEEEVPFLDIGLLLKGPDKGGEGDNDGHIASEALRGPERCFPDLFLLGWRWPCWPRMSAWPHACLLALADLAPRTTPWTSSSWGNHAHSWALPEQCLLPSQHKGPSWVLKNIFPTSACPQSRSLLGMLGFCPKCNSSTS